MDQPTSSDRSTTRTILLVALGIPLIALIAWGGIAVTGLITPPPPVEAETPVEEIDSAIDAASQYLNENKPATARTILASAIEKWPEDQRLCLLFGETMLQLALTTEDPDAAREYKLDALRQYNQAIVIGPEHPEHHHAAGMIAEDLGRLEDAAAHFAKAQMMAPSSAKYPLYLGHTLSKLGRHAEAKKNLLLAANLDPESGVAWASIAGIELDENNLDIALSMIRRARELEPYRTDWRIIEARVLRRQNHPEQALDLLLAAPEAARYGSGPMLFEVASCYGMLNQPGDAAALYVEAASRRPDDAEIQYQCAVWLERDGRADRAVAYCERASALGHADAARWLERRAATSTSTN
ncbi:MAG: tetratricopeptide repeat protein [Phycisphaerales bacterium]|nr:tetratricopeptide repeat protein [Phycisphaerales bacterium]